MTDTPTLTPGQQAEPAPYDPRRARYTNFQTAISNAETSTPDAPVSATRLELGDRAAYWEAFENSPDPLRAWDAIRWNFADAQARIPKEA